MQPNHRYFFVLEGSKQVILLADKEIRTQNSLHLGYLQKLELSIKSCSLNARLGQTSSIFCSHAEKILFLFQNLASLEDYDVLVDQVPMWERKLSSLLSDMKIKYDEDSPSVSVVEYLNYLYRVVSSLKKGLLRPDASTTIQPGEFKECTARILRFVSFYVIKSK